MPIDAKSLIDIHDQSKILQKVRKSGLVLEQGIGQSEVAKRLQLANKTLGTWVLASKAGKDFEKQWHDWQKKKAA